jgi:hypothetical protein
MAIQYEKDFKLNGKRGLLLGIKLIADINCDK